jgi:DNA-binding MarR family transcriptional regulator
MHQTNDPATQPRLDGTLRAVIRTFGLLRRVMDPYFAQFGVSGSQWGVLRVLHRAELEGHAALRLTDLCDRLLVRPPSVTGVVDRLQRQGLLARSKSADDHRVKEVRLTPAGRERVQRVLDNLPAQHELILGDLSGPERQQLQHLLDVVSQRLQGLASANDQRGDQREVAVLAREGS